MYLLGKNDIEIRYDPAGNRIAKDSTINGDRKYIVDVIGDLPTILLELDADSADYAVEKSYVYANSQILSQHDYSDSNDYFYLHDRLGSVRQIIDSNQKVEKYYQFTPFGQLSYEYSSTDAPSNPWQFTGQYFDDETGQYYLRARQYSPYISRFTGRDLIMGELEEPMTLHKYLYCGNDSINALDPQGLDIMRTGRWYAHQRIEIGSREDRENNDAWSLGPRSYGDIFWGNGLIFNDTHAGEGKVLDYIKTSKSQDEFAKSVLKYMEEQSLENPEYMSYSYLSYDCRWWSQYMFEVFEFLFK